MKRSQIWIITTLMSIALIGLVSFQLFWINSALKLNSERFRQHVFESMRTVALKLEKNRVATHLNKVVEFHADSGNFFLKRSFVTKPDTVRVTSETWTTNDTKDIKGTFSVILEDSVVSENLKQVKQSLSYSDPKIVRRLDKSQVVDLVITQLTEGNEASEVPDQQVLDSLLHQELFNKGINIKFQYVVTNNDKDSILLANFPHEQKLHRDFEYQTSLYPNDILGNLNYLAVNFPSENQFLFKQIWTTLASSLVLLSIIIFCFAYALNTIIKQKKISEIKNDFINNMTHEFKTPVATISLASEALREKEIYSDHNKLMRYVGIIMDENERLGIHVEKVLQSATLDKGDYKIKTEVFDLSELVKSAIESFQIKVQAANGKLIESIAKNIEIKGDPHHILNSINNLLDNALKYSSGIPEINVELREMGDETEISVSDKGIGLTKDELKRVFQKFYRVPKGDLHDVKGFGLGLSYVNSIVTLHGGKTRAQSDVGKGSTFTITLPKHG